ncbi:hypothetical protein DINM_006024 [Dirofilaria immitis]|nr:hypothetical protein [Dirofilaria immitis]
MHLHISIPNHRNEEFHIQTSELQIPQCASDAYQYISRIIENALEQTEQILLKLKTQHDDTIINIKNKRVHKKNSALSLNKLGFSAEQIPDDNAAGTLPVSVPQNLRKTNNASRQISNLLHFPIDDEERNLRFTDRIFISLDQKSIMLMREYDSSPNHQHHHQQQGPKLNDWYQQQAKEMDQYLQQIKKIGTHHLTPTNSTQPKQFQYGQLQQQTEIIQQQPHQRISRIQKHEVDEYKRLADKEKISSSSQTATTSPSFPTNAQVEFKSLSKDKDYYGKAQLNRTKKSDQKSKLHREELNESLISFQVNDQTTANEKTDSVKLSTSDTSLHRRKMRRKTAHKKTASLEHELAAISPSMSNIISRQNVLMDFTEKHYFKLFGSLIMITERFEKNVLAVYYNECSSNLEEEEMNERYEGSDEVYQIGKRKKNE